MNNFLNSTNLIGLAEQLGEALGRGVARGLRTGFGDAPVRISSTPSTGRRGRPPGSGRASSTSVVASPEKQCSVEGCLNPKRSKGLCSKHYQAARRKSEGQ